MLKTKEDLMFETTFREYNLLHHAAYAAKAVIFAGTSTGRMFGKFARFHLAEVNTVSN